MARFDNARLAREALKHDVSRKYRRILEAYADGVNHYLRQHRAELPPWATEISAADVLANGRAGAVGSAASAQLVSELKKKYEPTMTASSVSAGRSDAWLDGDGSNALALSGSRTASGKPILLGNPHLRWSSLYWEAHITVPGRINFYGSTLVGVPTLRAGFNDRLGYVQTNNDPDLEDVFALQADERATNRYRFNGKLRTLTRREIQIQVRQPDGSLTTERREAWDSHLGPVVYRTGAFIFVLRSEALDAWRYFEGFQELMPSRSLADFQARLRKGLVPTSNFTYADADGNILYQWNARLPRRVADGTSYALDVPGSTDKYVWKGVHPLADLPRLLNPPGGYIQNANNSPWYTSLRDRLDPAAYPPEVERHPLALRPQMALQLLESREKFSVDDVRALKFNTHVLLADRVLPDLLAAARAVASPSADLARAVSILSAWDRRADADSVGAALFITFWDTYRVAVPQPYATVWSEQAASTTPSGLADREAAVAALEQAVTIARERFGSEAAKWGDINRYRFGDVDLPADGADGAYGLYRVQRFDAIPDSTAGAPQVRVAGRLAEDQPLAGFGDGWILLVHFTSPVEAQSVLAYGQTTRPDSPHSHDQIRLFALHQLRRVFFSEADINANLERSYQP